MSALTPEFAFLFVLILCGIGGTVCLFLLFRHVLAGRWPSWDRYLSASPGRGASGPPARSEQEPRTEALLLTLARGTPGRGKVGLARLLAIFLMLLVLLALLLVFLGIWWGALLAASLAFLLKGAFRKQGARRDRYLREQFPEALDLLVRGARVGVSLEENLRTVAREMPAPTGPFFAGMVGQLDMGVPFETVLKKVAGQTGLREYRYFVATLSIQRLTGGAYADVLHRLSRMLRDYEEQAKRADVATSEARLSARIVAGLGIVSTISLFFLNRQQFEFLATDPEGQQILLYCLGSVLTGFAVISHLVGRIRE